MDIVLRFIIFIIFFIVSIQANDQINGLSVYLNIECQLSAMFLYAIINHILYTKYQFVTIYVYITIIYIYITTIYIVSYICEQNSL